MKIDGMVRTEQGAKVVPERIFQLASGYAAPFVIEAALKNRIFDFLDEGPQSIQEVHAASGASTRGLTAVMETLAGLGLLCREEDGRFRLSPEASAFLVSNKSTFQGGILARFSQHVVPRWMRLSEVVATGKPAEAINQEGPGTQFFRDLVRDLFPRNYPAAKALAQHLLECEVVRNGDTVLDVAAGSGVWGIALAEASDGIQVTAVDWPDVIQVTRETAARFELLDRFTFLESDIASTAFGNGYAVATLGHILHSEGERRSRALIEKVFEALRPGGTIAVAEFLVSEDRTGPMGGLFFAVNMLITTDEGNVYSFEEISSWLSDAGFVNARNLEVPGPSQVILATKPS